MPETFDRAQLRKELERDEGRKSHVYKDSLGLDTIGVGWCLALNPLPPAVLAHLGPDWCLEDGLDETAIDMLLDISINRACEDLTAIGEGYGFNWHELDADRQRVLLNMALNLGRSKLAAFHRMFTAIAEFLDGDTDSALDRAAREMLDSKWASQVGNRAKRLAARFMRV